MDYTGLPTLRHYLVLSQDEPRVWLWSRRPDGGWNGPEQVADMGAYVELSAFAVRLSLGELYASLFGQAAN